MKHPNCTRALLIALPALLVLQFQSTGVFAEDAKRGLKSRVPVTPFFEEPRFRESKPEPLESEKVLPEAKESPPAPASIASAARLQVNQIRVIGSSVIAPDELQTLVSPYEGRVVSIDELQTLRHQLSLVYFQRGYVNSGVVIPDQTIEQGIVEFRVIEGSLTRLNLTGNEDLFDSYLLNRIRLGVAEPLNVNDLQEALRGLQQNRLIKKINAQLKPAKELGQAELDVSVTEADSKRLSIAVDNYRSPSVGAEEVTLSYSDDNLIGFGDSLNLSLSKSEGLKNANVNYQMPLTANDTSLSVFYGFSDSEVIEEPFDQLEIESESRNYGLTLDTPIYKHKGASLGISVGLTLKDSDSFLLGEPFSFSAGAIEGESKTTVAELGAHYVHREANKVYAASLTARQGLDALDSNVNDDGDIPDSEFLALLGQAQYARLLETLPGSQVIFQTAFQWSFDPLLSVEKFAMGGHNSVRGYRENQLVRDNGVTASLEFRYPLFADENGIDPYHFQLAPFLDWGKAWDEDVPSQNDEKLNIYSAGLGMLWQPIKGLDMEVYWGEALEDEVKPDTSEDLQDDGVHASIRYSMSF